MLVRSTISFRRLEGWVHFWSSSLNLYPKVPEVISELTWSSIWVYLKLFESAWSPIWICLKLPVDTSGHISICGPMCVPIRGAMYIPMRGLMVMRVVIFLSAKSAFNFVFKSMLRFAQYCDSSCVHPSPAPHNLPIAYWSSLWMMETVNGLPLVTV